VNEREALASQLYGESSHKHHLHALEGLDPALAGRKVGRSPHTVFQILQHMTYWQDISLARISGEPPPRPGSAALGWTAPAAPEDESDWQAAIACFAEGLRSLEARVRDPELDLGRLVQPDRNVSAREELLMIQGHNSYHLGQIVLLRQELGAWPPPRGGDTW
jgi:uncharacterized damage-inducible protein DinB